MDPRVILGPIGADDMDFLLRVYRSTREEELAMVVDWTEEMKDAFVRQQFNAQQVWYQEHYKGATFDVVLVDGVPAGRLYVNRRPKEIRLVDSPCCRAPQKAGLGPRSCAA